MRPRALHIAGVVLGTVLLIDAGVTPLQAQSRPTAGAEDLTVPPDLRGGAPASAPAEASPRVRPNRIPAHRHRDPKDGGQTAAKADPKPSGEGHPVELGVTMRGGSGTSRVYAPSGGSEAIQEGGSAFGAGMKFGF